LRFSGVQLRWAHTLEAYVRRCKVPANAGWKPVLPILSAVR
jgi:hypothetical protein